MEESLEVKLKQFQSLECQIHQEPIVQMCLKSSCNKYFQLECAECTQSHPEHSNKFIKTIKQILTVAIKGLDELQVKLRSNQNQKENENILNKQKSDNLKTLAKEFLISSEILKNISNNILKVAERLSDSENEDFSNNKQIQQQLQETLRDILGKNNIESLNKIQNLKSFIKQSEQDFNIQFLIERPQKKKLDTDQFYDKMKKNLVSLTTCLNQIANDSQVIEQKSIQQQQQNPQGVVDQKSIQNNNQISNQIFSSSLKADVILLDSNKTLIRHTSKGWSTVLCENKLNKEVTSELKIKINKCSQLGMGICLKNKTYNRQFKGWDGNKIGYGFYQFALYPGSTAQYKYNNHNEEENNKKIEFDNFSVGDILNLKFDHQKSVLSLTNNKNNKNKPVELTIQFPLDDDLHFCVTLQDKDDEIIIIQDK